MGVRLLLDTHAAAWWWQEDGRLPDFARDAIGSPDSEVFVSPVVPWELATKHRLGKWDDAAGILASIEQLMVLAEFLPLPISITHAKLAGGMVWDHRDPFDRMIVAQALTEALVVVTGDAAIRRQGVMTLWDRAA